MKSRKLSHHLSDAYRNCSLKIRLFFCCFSQKKACFWLSSISAALWALTLIRPSTSPDDANIVRESTEILDVSPSITTNVIGQKTDEVGSDMCERSCEELSTMFQELNGLRVIVSNLIDGLQKVVSGSVFFCLGFVLLQMDRCCCCPKKTTILEKIDIFRK